MTISTLGAVWPDGDDVAPVVAVVGETIGFVRKVDQSYDALDAGGSILGIFPTRATAYACVVDVARAKRLHTTRKAPS
jgi:hypothetical protein